MTTLQDLSLIESKVACVDVLGHLTNLTELWLTEHVVEIGALEACKNLKQVTVQRFSDGIQALQDALPDCNFDLYY